MRQNLGTGQIHCTAIGGFAAPELAARLHRQMELYERLPAEPAG